MNAIRVYCKLAGTKCSCKKLVPPAGFEPAMNRVQVGCVYRFRHGGTKNPAKKPGEVDGAHASPRPCYPAVAASGVRSRVGRRPGLMVRWGPPRLGSKDGPLRPDQRNGPEKRLGAARIVIPSRVRKYVNGSPAINNLSNGKACRRVRNCRKTRKRRKILSPRRLSGPNRATPIRGSQPRSRSACGR